MEESPESQPQWQPPFVQESAKQQKLRIILLVGLACLALLGGIIYFNILTKPMGVPSIQNNAVLNPTITLIPTPIPTAGPTPLQTYRVKEHIDYTLSPGWKEETSDTQTQLGVVVEEGLRFSSPPVSGSTIGSGVTVSISRYPKALTQTDSMQQLTDKMKAIYPNIMDLKQTTFDNWQAIHFWNDVSQTYEQYIVLQDNTFEFLWYIDVVYLGSDAEITELKKNFQPQVSQIFQSMHFRRP